jgi:inorganic pyrophosphatase
MASLLELPAFADDDTCHVVVESPRGSPAKYKYDAKAGVMTLSRPLPLGLAYPYDWGFIPSTRAADGDPLDVVVMWDAASYPGVVISCRVIGALEVEQANRTTRARERNDRLVVIPATSIRLETIRSVFDLAERARLELEQFFTAAVAFERKELTIKGWAGPDEATELLHASVTRA